MTPKDAALLSDHRAADRLAADRRLGWTAVPSNSFQGQKSGTDVILEGVGQGHSVGLCQRGTRAMAEEGADFREITNHYFPNTSLGHVAPHPSPESRMERQVHP